MRVAELDMTNSITSVPMVSGSATDSNLRTCVRNTNFSWLLFSTLFHS